jgi:hypothetical protein
MPPSESTSVFPTIGINPGPSVFEGINSGSLTAVEVAQEGQAKPAATNGNVNGSSNANGKGKKPKIVKPETETEDALFSEWKDACCASPGLPEELDLFALQPAPTSSQAKGSHDLPHRRHPRGRSSHARLYDQGVVRRSIKRPERVIRPGTKDPTQGDFLALSD